MEVEREGKSLGKMTTTDKQGPMGVIYGSLLGAASRSWSCGKTLAFLFLCYHNDKYGLLAWVHGASSSMQQPLALQLQAKSKHPELEMSLDLAPRPVVAPSSHFGTRELQAAD